MRYLGPMNPFKRLPVGTGLLLLLLSACAPVTPGGGLKSTTQNLVYGTDNRKDLYEISDPKWRSYSKAIGVILHKSFVEGDGDNLTITDNTLNQEKEEWYRKPLCADVKFRSQLQPGSCSGFLVAPSIFATAGHCVAKDLETKRVVMNFSISDSRLAASNSLSISRSQVYSFRRVLATQYDIAKDSAGDLILDSKGDAQRVDYALVELDRPVEGAIPFEFDRTETSQVGDPVLLLGHPEGLPLKYADGARIRASEGLKYFTNMDAFHGNSGSLVLNLRTGKVAGIYTTTSLIPDWSYDSARNCMKVTPVDEGFGGDRPDEGVVKFSEVLSRLNGEALAALSQTPVQSGGGSPGAAGKGTCVLNGGSTGFDFFYSDPVLDRAEHLYVSSGAVLEILGEEAVYFKGEAHEGIRLRVISNSGPSYAALAQPGMTVWYFKVLLTCRN